MPILNKDKKEEVNKYNNFLNENNASFTQTLNWAKVKNDWQCEVVYIEESGKILASMLILLKKIPLFNKYMMYSPRGPVCDFNNIEIVNKLIKECYKLKEKYNIFVVKFDPEINNDNKLVELYKKNGFKIKIDDKVIQPRYNMILDLDNETEESLLKRFSSKTRYNIRLAGRKDVKVRYSNDAADLKIFYDLYKVTTIRDNIGCRAYEYFERMLNNFNKSEIRIYIAEHEREPLASAICINVGKKAFYLYGASSNNKRNLMPNYLMQWEMIKWAIETKCLKYDFGGVFEFTNKNGLYKFKSGFCKEEGVTEFIGEIDKIYDKKVYFVYNKLIPMFKKIKKIMSKLFNK